MSTRLPTHLLVGALLRRVNGAGGMATVSARGEPDAGAVLLILSERGGPARMVERGIGPDGTAALIATGPAGDSAPGAVTDYWQWRRARDPDLWVVELDVPEAERFAAETFTLD